ncbi:MAG TPA: BREX-1 system phosphatase PglZ type A [Verrucomicrobiae bacterium]|nr:BREX-1 system phosphatase PglZ type A [Verrucomicrobiae bacterium]
MSNSRIQSALEKEFTKKRVIFWYDGELIGWQQEYESLELPGVVKLAVQNNEFGVKHRIAHEAADRKFLLYFRGQTQPEDKDNWLLDQLLAHGGKPFSPDRASLALLEADLPEDFKGITEQHLEFFRSTERTTRLKELRKPDDTETEVRLKMLAIICRTEPSVESVMLTLLDELARLKSERWAQVEKFSLADFWWKQLAAHFGYIAPKPSLLDFVLALFRAVTPLGGNSNLDPHQSLVLLNRWMDSGEHRDAFEALSDRADGMLNVSAALNQVEDVRPLLTAQTYRRIDLKVLADLRDGLVNGTLSPGEARNRVEARSQLHWARYDLAIQSLYRALGLAAELIETLPKLDLTIESFDAGLEKYASTWWRVDQLYRRFIFFLNESGETALLEKLAARIEGLYVNEFLNNLAQRWQEWVDRCMQWASGSLGSQRDLVPRLLQTQLAEGRKVFVVVSDALRFEAARQLLDAIMREERWTAELKPALGALPSFTQLGMAALLPHRKLEFAPDGKTVLADGATTVGTDARSKILARAFDGRATAISAEAFLALNSKTDGRDLAKANDVVFIYHNAIDAVGDKRDTENRTCAVVESAIEEIIKLLKKAAAMNVSHFVITADHGFLYQNNALEESDFLAVAQPAGVLQYQRRFIVATALQEDSRLKRFSASQLGLAGTLQVAFPKGVQRLRLQGAGSRYVHGGTALQEIIVPMIEVKKLRADDVGRVEVEILRSGQQITTGQVAITFLQCEPVGEKCLLRELRAGFYSRTGVRLSDVRTLRFDSAAEDARQRERREQFVFGREAEEFNGQEIVLRLDEQVLGTAQFAPYREFIFKLRRAFESDFDDI